MDIQEGLNDPTEQVPAEHQTVAPPAIAAAVLLGGALLVAPWLRHHRAQIEHAATQVGTQGRDWAKRIVEKLPWVKPRQD